MKIFAVLFLTAVIAYASADDALAAPAEEYVGYLQDAGSTDIVSVGFPTDCGQPSNAPGGFVTRGCPRRGLLPDLCAAKCVIRGHKGGHCVGNLCQCIN